MDRRMDRRTVARARVPSRVWRRWDCFRGAMTKVERRRPLRRRTLRRETTPTEPSLYDRLGGYFAIAAVVNRFSDQIITTRHSTKTRRSRRGTRREAEARLPGLKFGRTLWIAAAAGGPFEYTGLPLSEAHTEFNLTAEQFAEVGAEIVRALDFFEVPEREQQELVAAYKASMSDVVTATE